MIGFNVPIYMKESIDCIKEAAESRKICGDGAFTKKCSEWMENKFNAHKVLMTTSCTSALEMAAILLDLKPGDEVIMPSYTFVSTADAFVMVGAKVVFVDVNPDTMNIDEEKIKEAITDKTKAIAVVHYAGISPDMDKVMKIAKEHNLKVVEDAAQGFMAKYKDKYLGTIGDIGCYSFHETKNYSMGEGGALGNKPDFTKVTNPKQAVIKFIFTKADVEELEKIKREHPEYIYYISPIDEINSHKIIDSSTRYGYYILAI